MPFQLSLMFAGKARVYPREAPFRCSTVDQAPALSHKHKTRLEKLAKDKRSSLLWKVVTYGRKRFYNIDTWSPLHPEKSWKKN